MTYRPQILAVAFGGTGLNATVANQILYSSGTNTIAGLATANGGVLSTNSSGVPSIDTTNFVVLSTGLQLKGNNTNTAPPAGFIGETITSTATSISLSSSASPQNLTSIVLTPGVWDINAVAFFHSTSGGIQEAIMTVSTVSATIQNVGSQGGQFDVSCNTGTLYCPAFRQTLSAPTTTIYLVGQATFPTNTNVDRCRISATRVG